MVKLRSGAVIEVTSPQTLDVGIPATTVTGTITVNGAQVGASMGLWLSRGGRNFHNWGRSQQSWEDRTGHPGLVQVRS